MNFQDLIKEHGDLSVKEFVDKVGEKTAAEELKKATQRFAEDKLTSDAEELVRKA